MTIECVCGNWHGLTPTAMAAVIRAFQEGEMQSVGPDGVHPMCMEEAFTKENIAVIAQRYPGRSMTFTKGGVDAT